ncbi:MAG: DegV family protein [Chloroflexi bacterium]|nr:MAG: DegV family protein [Chloroflexota bacterium]
MSSRVSSQRSGRTIQASRSRCSRATSSTTRSSSRSNSRRLRRSFAVVTDSTADLPNEWRDRYEIEIVPLKVLFGQETFRDRVDMTDEEFFRRLAASTSLPTTSAPSPGEFADVYRGCISIHIGAQLSATAEAARLGASSVDGFTVNVVDSETVSMPIAFLCRIAAESSSLAEATAAVEQRVPRCRVLALLDTLRYVEMGGRVSRAQAMIGTMLDLKPLLLVANREIKSVDRVRTRSRAIARMIEFVRAEQPVERLAVMHAQAPEEAEAIAAQLRNKFPDLEVPVGQIGCVLGTHTGPKALGLVYIKTQSR